MVQRTDRRQRRRWNLVRRWLLRARQAVTTRTYRPDHNGECLNCDEWFDAHAPNGECPSDVDLEGQNK